MRGGRATRRSPSQRAKAPRRRAGMSGRSGRVEFQDEENDHVATGVGPPHGRVDVITLAVPMFNESKSRSPEKDLLHFLLADTTLALDLLEDVGQPKKALDSHLPAHLHPITSRAAAFRPKRPLVPHRVSAATATTMVGSPAEIRGRRLKTAGHREGHSSRFRRISAESLPVHSRSLGTDA